MGRAGWLVVAFLGSLGIGAWLLASGHEVIGTLVMLAALCMDFPKEKDE